MESRLTTENAYSASRRRWSTSGKRRNGFQRSLDMGSDSMSSAVRRLSADALMIGYSVVWLGRPHAQSWVLGCACVPQMIGKIRAEGPRIHERRARSSRGWVSSQATEQTHPNLSPAVNPLLCSRVRYRYEGGATNPPKNGPQDRLAPSNKCDTALAGELATKRTKFCSQAGLAR